MAEELTIKEFLDENGKLISIVGILGVLLIFLNSLPFPEIFLLKDTTLKDFTMFSLFLMFVILSWELLGIFRKIELEFMKIRILEYVFLIYFVSILVYFTSTFRVVIKLFFVFLFIVIYLEILFYINEKINSISSIRVFKDKHREFFQFYADAIELIIFIIVFLISIVSTTTIMNFLPKIPLLPWL
ncbi:MAG: hypothetical protein OH319_03545 [Candidatus Parvarchaeota archaeon]|nr:hypothetical protein [Candidatus Jingweiarchaeum tengchongense]MCW1298556.1 hypothetical protein [Candidatus Jingweiarchaeum tengchongense]MCW1304579.1 hypothetical protein [Candidatus Jingweiarchaeum tengchongense]MCW1309874.1 hypothetical protein [Candidatus Jingweiarchaeum tengchongense]MCW1310251.1 hypothetical protein [Candidatus Jingweiarchaeum tengchongense]